MDVMSPDKWFQKLNSMFVAKTRQPWKDRFSQRPSQGQAASRDKTPRDQFLDLLWSYFVGDPPLPFIAEEYRDEFRDVLRKARGNYGPMVVRATLDRMELQGVSTLDDSDANGDDLAAEILAETGFVATLKTMLEFLFAMGESYLMVVPGDSSSELIDGTDVPMPTIHAIDPRRCIGVPDPKNPTRLRAALVKEYDDITDQEVAYLFLPGRKWELRQGAGAAGWSVVNVEAELIDGIDHLGGIPIVRFDNPQGMGEYEPHIDLLDRINDTTLQRIIGFWYAALQARAVIGDDPEPEPGDPELTDDEMRQQDQEALKAGPGQVWRFPSEFQVWEGQVADFNPFTIAKRDDVQELAAVTSTPLHLITPEAADGSAEGAGLIRESATAKVKDRRARVAPQLRLVWRMVFAFAGQADRGKRIRFHWGPIEFRTLSEMANASAQSTETLSTEDRCERIWQMTPDEIDRNMQRREAERLTALADAAALAAQQAALRPTPGGGESPPRPNPGASRDSAA